jgi:hypothetical protein
MAARDRDWQQLRRWLKRELRDARMNPDDCDWRAYALAVMNTLNEMTRLSRRRRPTRKGRAKP